MDWIIVLYFLFIILTGILSAIKEAQRKKISIPKKIEPYLPEEELEREKIEGKIKRDVQEVKKPQEKPILTKKMKLEEKPFTFLEKDLKEKLPEAIILMEILGPPKAFQGFGPPYRRKLR
ncbi:MAG: hypothetical protein N2516_00860 [Dictyoglomaceae bacterium]|nr:hypothetical protein [Dictyoglomaceae bacterium]